jgi:hypothetical protein
MVVSSFLSVWCTPLKWCLGTDGGGGIEELDLNVHAFRRFEYTLGAMFDDGRDPDVINWAHIMLAAIRHMQGGTPNRFKTPPVIMRHQQCPVL